MRYILLALVLSACAATPTVNTQPETTTTTTEAQGVDEIEAWMACERVLRQEVAGAVFPSNYGSEDEWMVQNGDGWIVMAWVASDTMPETDFRCVVDPDGGVDEVTVG